MPDKPKDHTYHLTLPARSIKLRDGSTREILPMHVEVEISGWAVQQLAEQAQRNKTRRARSGPATARAYLNRSPR